MQFFLRSAVMPGIERFCAIGKMPIRAQKLNFFVICDSFHFGSVSKPIFVLTLELNKT
jgi:hypothetical protein